MLWPTLLFALLLSLGALAYVLWPIVSRDVPLLPVDDDRLADLLARKDRALRSIKELEFDHQVGKIGDEDYQRFKYRLSQQAIALIQQVEKLTPATAELEEALEAEIAQLRRVQATTRTAELAAPPNGKASTAAKPLPATSSKSAAARFCTECGTEIQPTFKFCASCGAPVAWAAVAQEG